MRIGFIGLGTMGAHMAANLQKAGHALQVNDLRREACAAAIKAGATWCPTPAAAVEGAEVVFLSLPTPKDVEAVVFGADGVLSAVRPGQAVFDLSTNSREMVQRIHAALAQKGAQGLDAPVSGGPEGARTGRLAVWVGGDAATYERCLPVLRDFADAPQRIGAIGAGTAAKLVHNMAGFAARLVTAECFTMGVKAGVDPLELWKAIRKGAFGRNGPFERLTDQFLPDRYEPPAFALKLAFKDASLALEMARDLGVPMKLCATALAEMQEAMNRGWGNLDSAAVMKLQQERAGVRVECDPDAIRAAANDH